MNARAALVALTPLLVAPTLASTAHPASLSGRLIGSVDRQPLAFATVVLVGTRCSTQSGEDGTFRLDDVPEGRLTLRVQRPGLRPMTQDILVGTGDQRLGDVVVEQPQPPAPVAVGSRARVRADQLEATIRPVPGRFVVGDAPRFEVRIRNRGDESVWLVRSVDASDAWASPRVTVEIEGPEGGFRVRPFARCGNHNGVGRRDFVEVPAGREDDRCRCPEMGGRSVHRLPARARPAGTPGAGSRSGPERDGRLRRRALTADSAAPPPSHPAASASTGPNEAARLP